MRAEIRVEMPSPRACMTAVKAIGAGGEGKRASLRCSAKGTVFTGVVEASDFTALRARTTSLLRDLKVFLDSLKAVGGKK